MCEETEIALNNRIMDLEEINKEHQKLIGELRKEIEELEKENKKIRKKFVELTNDNQFVTSIKIIEITPSDELVVIRHDNVILQEITLRDKGYKVSFYDCKNETKKAEWVSLDAIFYFDNRGLQIEIDHY